MAERRLLLDGELVALRSDGSQGFHALMARRRSARLVFVAFDVLHVDGLYLVDAPYSARRHELNKLQVRDHHRLTRPRRCTMLRLRSGASLSDMAGKASLRSGSTRRIGRRLEMVRGSRRSIRMLAIGGCSGGLRVLCRDG